MSERDKLIKKYVQNMGDMYIINHISKSRNILDQGGHTIVVNLNNSANGGRLFLNSNTYQLHSDYECKCPINDKTVLAFFESALERYVDKCKNQSLYIEELNDIFYDKFGVKEPYIPIEYENKGLLTNEQIETIKNGGY